MKNIKVRLAESVGCEEQTKKYDFENEKCLAVSEMISFLNEVTGAAVVQLKKADLM